MGELEKKLFQQEPAMPHSCDCPTWIYNVICPGLFLHLLFSELRWLLLLLILVKLLTITV
jgi:hypothetical protein